MTIGTRGTNCSMIHQVFAQYINKWICIACPFQGSYYDMVTFILYIYIVEYFQKLDNYCWSFLYKRFGQIGYWFWSCVTFDRCTRVHQWLLFNRAAICLWLWKLLFCIKMDNASTGNSLLCECFRIKKEKWLPDKIKFV